MSKILGIGMIILAAVAAQGSTEKLLLNTGFGVQKCASTDTGGECENGIPSLKPTEIELKESDSSHHLFGSKSFMVEKDGQAYNAELLVFKDVDHSFYEVEFWILTPQIREVLATSIIRVRPQIGNLSPTQTFGISRRVGEVTYTPTFAVSPQGQAFQPRLNRPPTH
jgi:hypothetical protein